MAKVSFKDMIFKLLKKDEGLVKASDEKKLYTNYKAMGMSDDAAREAAAAAVNENLGAYGGVKQNKPKSFKVKFAMPNNPNNIAVSAYQSEKDAEKFKKSILAKGGKAILTKEDAPANATGTAVVGTGDDSSTVVVKKKKRLQDKLMRRMGIKETIDRVIPDLEYPKDEIRERANELKKLASKSKDTRAPIYKQQAKNIAKAAKIKPFKKEDTVSETPQGYALVQKAKDIAKKMSGNMNDAVKEIEKLEKGLSNNSSVKDALQKANESVSEGERALARDKSTDQPKKYVSGLTSKQKKSHDKHLEKQGKKSDSDKSAYKQSPADKVAKTKPSKHTNKFKQMYGEDYLNEKIKGLETKAKKSGMPYGILKKVYDRGMAAWKGGHRPGTTPQQWAFARVNSFTTKSSGTWGKADSDLAKQVRGS